VGLAWERRLASALIVGNDYGTRASTVVTMDAKGGCYFEERTRGEDGGVANVVQLEFGVR
jgi:uncharacterized protein with NRDE domain